MLTEQMCICTVSFSDSVDSLMLLHKGSSQLHHMTYDILSSTVEKLFLYKGT